MHDWENPGCWVNWYLETHVFLIAPLFFFKLKLIKGFSPKWDVNDFLGRLNWRLNLPNGLFFVLCWIKPQIRCLCVSGRPGAPLVISEAQKVGARMVVQQNMHFCSLNVNNSPFKNLWINLCAWLNRINKFVTLTCNSGWPSAPGRGLSGTL